MSPLGLLARVRLQIMGRICRRFWRWEERWWMVAVGTWVLASSIVACVFWDELRGVGESPSETIRNLGVVVGGVVAILLTVWRSTIATRQLETSQGSLLNERYQEATRMLGSDVLSVRLGGIHALSSLARERPEQYHLPAMELLSAFVRHPIGEAESKRDSPALGGSSDEPVLREDVQAAVTALGRRSSAGLAIEEERFAERATEMTNRGIRDTMNEYTVLDLHGADLSGAELGYLNLAGANLCGAKLDYASLLLTKLSRAKLVDASLTYAMIGGLDMSRASLGGADLSFAYARGVNMSHASLDATMLHTDISEADLSHAYLGISDMSHAKMEKTNLSGARFGMTVRPSTRVSRQTQGEVEREFARLTQQQLDQAKSDTDNPPEIPEGTLDIDTGEQLVWRATTDVPAS